MASLIDQRDTNGDTTWIEYANSDPAAAPLRAYGVDRTPSSEPGAPPPPAGGTTVLNRAFRNVGELGYAYRNGATTLDFRAAGSVDARLLDLFTFNTAPLRAGVISLNTGNIAVITAILMGRPQMRPQRRTPAAQTRIRQRRILSPKSIGRTLLEEPISHGSLAQLVRRSEAVPKQNKLSRALWPSCRKPGRGIS